MTLTDAGPLVALLDKNDIRHVPCRAFLPRLSPPMRTTWPCFTEAMYLLGRTTGHKGQDQLWEWAGSGFLTFYEITPEQRLEMRLLMTKYKDRPMDLADASLVVVANALGIRRVFTTDGDFLVYRTEENKPFEVVP